MNRLATALSVVAVGALLANVESVPMEKTGAAAGSRAIWEA